MARRIDVDVEQSLKLKQDVQTSDGFDAHVGFQFYILTTEGIPDYWEDFSYLVETTCSAF